MAKLVDLLGQRFGHLVVIGLVTNKWSRDWQCQCDCGKVILKKTKLLTQRGHITCGDRKNCPYLKALTFGGNRLPIRARLSDLASAEELRSLVKQPCEYCGNHDSNGIAEGATQNNILCVCVKCRTLRNKMGHFEFIRQVKQIAKHQGWGEAE